MEHDNHHEPFDGGDEHDMDLIGEEGSILLNELGNAKVTPALFLLGVGLGLAGKIYWALLAFMIGTFFGWRTAVEHLNDEEKREIRFNILQAEDLVIELKAIVDEYKKDNENDNNNNDTEPKKPKKKQEQTRKKCVAALTALVKKCNKRSKPENMPLLCQESAYMTLKLFPDDNDVVSCAVAVLALVAKDPRVRQRNIQQADEYGLNIPIQAIRKALVRAQQEESDQDTEEDLAEIQRKGCLYLGALADGDEEYDIGVKITEEDGLEVVIDAINWFRFHDGVVNWGLWSIFILCYDNPRNKVQLVRLGGINTICQSLKNLSDSLEVNRHGIAVLFDLLREERVLHEDSKIDSWEVRRLALAAGLHKVVLSAMTEFSDSMDIMMMGQEMLIGTGYRGEIPQYQQM